MAVMMTLLHGTTEKVVPTRRVTKVSVSLTEPLLVTGPWRMPTKRSPKAQYGGVSAHDPTRQRHRAEHVRSAKPGSSAKPAARGSAAHRAISWLPRARDLALSCARGVFLSAPQYGVDTENEGRRPG
jgi:hypothetical protein